MPEVDDPVRTPAQAAERYFETWRQHDFDAFRALLADDCTFSGPLGTAEDGDECRRGIEGMSKIVTGIVIQKMVSDGPDVLTWFELHTNVADEPSATVNWMQVEDGMIRRIRVTFDPRPLVS
jgi:hypothetical protein